MLPFNFQQMKKLLLLLVCTFYISQSYAQTWSDDVAEIFYEKCTKCHHSGGVAPFELMSYNQSSAMASAIYDAVALDKMPPWPPNNNYQSYAHDKSLSSTQKTTVLNWLTNGTPEGNPANAPAPPVYNSGSLLGNGDLTIQIPVYSSKATAQQDDYVCFAMPSGLPTNRKIKSIEIVPGNRSIVHHCLIYVDPSNTATTDTIGGDCGSPNSSQATLLLGYTPGSSPMTLPSTGPLKLGMDMPANSTVVFAMHYPAGSFGQADSTKAIFHFYPPGETGIRNVNAAPVLQNWSFSLPPNQQTNVSAQYPASGGIPSDVSILSVFPHMHLLGKTMTVYGLDVANDTIPFINIPHWDFHWQDFYFFRYIQKASAGTTLKVDALYDNTAGNIHNPNSPPITVNPGLNTSDEMCLVYAHFMAYQNGDELYDLEELMNDETNSIIEQVQENRSIKTYPNPFDESITIEIDDLAQGDNLSIIIYDYTGARVKSLITTSHYSGAPLNWDGTNDNSVKVKDGMYFLSIIHGENNYNQAIIKH